ncbi:MAG: SDR family NAD(P)-dependent oxidoreductase, partial [Pseudomonadales bacterium]
MATALITGCSSGFGQLTAFEFARHAHKVYATVRTPAAVEKLQRAAGDAGLSIDVVPLDVTDREAIEPAVQRVLDEAGAIDVLVNNAGVTAVGALEDIDESDIERVMRTNFLGPVWLTRAVLPQMRVQGSGHV